MGQYPFGPFPYSNMMPPWIAPLMLHNLNVPRFDGTNIVKSISALEDISRQFSYPTDQILSLLKQHCASSDLVYSIEKVTAGLNTWALQSQELLAYFKTSDTSSQVDPGLVIEAILRQNPSDDLEEWKRRIADYNQALMEAGEASDQGSRTFYKTLPSRIKKWLLSGLASEERVEDMPWTTFKDRLLAVLNRELEYSKQDHYLAVKGLPDRSQTDLWNQQNRQPMEKKRSDDLRYSKPTGVYPEPIVQPARYRDQGDNSLKQRIDDLANEFADLKIEQLRM
jgi:hypothetical protein